jgi:superfamily II DNA/RNA helicase
LIAQSKNGTGKTGAFGIGSILRVDPSDQKVQLLVLAHTRELSIQIYNVYAALAKGTDIKVSNLVETGNTKAHVIVSTLGKI